MSFVAVTSCLLTETLAWLPVSLPILMLLQDIHRACDVSQHGDDSGANALPPGLPGRGGQGEIRVHAEDIVREV